MTLVILAAGMGSRYGGLKQIDPIGPCGEFIIDFSIYDALKAGFDKVVFIIKEENYDIFRKTVGARIENRVQVEYVFQDIRALPAGYAVPAERVKPWGTAHALLCAKDAVNDPFLVINSDDFYGRDSYLKMAQFFADSVSGQKDGGKLQMAMCGFVLKNTLSENGHVARGVCETNAQGHLIGVTERTKIQRNQGVTQYYEEETGWTDVDENSVVSMNMWGFTPEIFDIIEKDFPAFLDQMKNPLKDEYFLPLVVQNMIDAGIADFTVVKTMSKWYGVTYQQDKPTVQEFIDRSIADGVYPKGLWN